MVSFAQELTPKDVAAIRDYIIARVNQSVQQPGTT